MEGILCCSKSFDVVPVFWLINIAASTVVPLLTLDIKVSQQQQLMVAGTARCLRRYIEQEEMKRFADTLEQEELELLFLVRD